MSLFEFSKNNTNPKREIFAGITTFFTMAYIIVVNPTVLSKTGMDFQSVLLATCIASALGTLVMALLTNYPFALAPGMGLNAFFTYSIVFGLGYTWQQALTAVFLSGILLILLTLSGWRKKIIYSLPDEIIHAIPVGIGFFICFIGMNNGGIIRFNQGPILDIIDNFQGSNVQDLIPQVLSAPPQVLELGHFSNPSPLMALLGFVITVVLLLLKVHGALFWGIVATTLISVSVGFTHIPQDLWSWDFSYQTVLAFDWRGLFFSSQNTSFWSILFTSFTVVITFSLIDLLDTIGTLMGTASKGNFLDKQNRLPKMSRALMADSIASTVGAMLGTSTVSSYVESGAGILSGGRTGLTGITVSALFLVFLVLSPLVAIIPPAATSPALILVGFMMFSNIQKINWKEIDTSLPAFAVIIIIPFTYSIANGIAIGLILYTFIHLVKRDFKKLNPVVVILSLLFLLRFTLI